MKSPVALLLAFLVDIRRLEPDVYGLDRDELTIMSRFEHEGYGFLAVALPSLGKALDRGLSTGVFACPDGFERIHGRAIPKFLQGMFSEVFDPFSGKLLDVPSKGVVTLLREFLYIYKKVAPTQEKSDQLDSKSKASFLETDERLTRLNLSSETIHLIKSISRLVLNDPSLLDFSSMMPKNGPGAVSEGLISNQKWNEIYEAVLFEDYLITMFNLGDFIHSSTGNLPCTSEADLLDRPSKPSGQPSSSKARYCSVPKNYSSNRGITVEPVAKQFVQQALNTALRDAISKDPILKQCLSLSDQSENQKLAMEGSIHDNWATLDLKSASDLLSVELISVAFDHLPEFFEMVMACRTSYCEIDHKVYSLRKFAGMGNALTFPVQSVVFAIVMIAAIHSQDGRRPSHGSVMRAARRIRVFGDDIIVPVEYAHSACIWLERVGLEPNMSKSFLKGHFKESCGVDAYDGVDVTPLYLKTRPDISALSASDLDSLVSFSNHAWLRCLYSLSEFVKDLVEDFTEMKLPLVRTDSSVLGWHTRCNATSIQRWNTSSQRFEYRSLMTRARKRPDVIDGVPALMKCLMASKMFDDKEHLVRSDKRYATYVSPRWVGSVPLKSTWLP